MQDKERENTKEKRAAIRVAPARVLEKISVTTFEDHNEISVAARNLVHPEAIYDDVAFR